VVEQLLKEVEQGRVGPMQVLDHQHEGTLPGNQVEEPPPGDKGLVPAGRRLGEGREPHQRRQPRLQPLALRGVAGDGADRRVQLGGNRQGSSDSMTPAWALMIWPNAQKPTAWP
jgi:hypothetical protein